MDFREMFKQTNKVDFNEVHSPTNKPRSLNEAGDPKLQVAAKTNDSVTLLIGDKRYIYRRFNFILIFFVS